MSFTTEERIHIEKLVAAFVRKHRPKPQLRSALDLGYRIHEQSVEIFEIRPTWRDASARIEIPIAKTTYVRTRLCWRVLCQMRGPNWSCYAPCPEVARIEEFFDLVEQDKTGCFFG